MDLHIKIVRSRPKNKTKCVGCGAAGARWGTQGTCRPREDTLKTSEALSARGKTKDRGPKWIPGIQMELRDNLAVY